MHGWVALQRPLQTPIRAGCLCNCRAETVPAHRTVITRAAKSVALIFLPMIALLSSKRAADAEASAFPNYFFGGLSGPGSLTHPPVFPLNIWQRQGPLQWTVVLHVPLQTGSRLAGVCNCRAETVPAQRTAAAIAASNVFLIVLLIIHSPFSVRLMRAFAGCYFPEGATPASFVVQNAVVGVVKEQTQSDGGTRPGERCRCRRR